MLNLIIKNKALIGVVVGVAALLYLYFQYFGSSSGPLVSSSSSAGAPVSQDLLVTLGSLHTIKLDPGVFSDPVFMSLADFGVTLPPEPAGRRNPFAAVGK